MKDVLSSKRFLAVYSGVVTLVFAVTILSGFAAKTKKVSFEELDVQRINIVEPDGTLRMVISDKTRFPGGIIRGKEYPFDRQAAGMIFYNDEATENGGLIFGGKKEKDGMGSSYGHLSFDAFEQDQVFTIDAQQQGKMRGTGIAMMDRPEWPIVDALELMQKVKNLPEAQQKAEMEKFMANHAGPKKRLYLGRSEDDSVGMTLQDAEGRARMQIQVAADGSPVIKFLDETGKVVSQLPAK